MVLGATNLVEDVDDAIRRSGRFDERVERPATGHASSEAASWRFTSRKTHADAST